MDRNVSDVVAIDRNVSDVAFKNVNNTIVEASNQTNLKWPLIIFAILSLLGFVGFSIKVFVEGVGSQQWGYHAALVAFLLSSIQSAPMVAIAPRVAKAHWRRSTSRIAEIFGLLGIVNLLLFIPLMWILPSLADGRRSLWFYDALEGVSPYSPHIWAILAIVVLAFLGVFYLWLSLLPDFAILRDHSKVGTVRKKIFKFLSGRWWGSSSNWYMHKHRLGIVGAHYFMLLVFVHFLYSMDFCMSLVPGWIDALFPITHAANALQAGVAVFIVAMYIIYRFGGYREYIGLDQFWALSRLLFALSLLWFWFWFSSFIILWYGGKPSERFVLELLMAGPYIYVFIPVFILNFAGPLLIMMWNAVRKSILGPTIVSIGVLIGTMLDRVRLYVGAYSVSTEPDKYALHSVPNTIWPQFSSDVLLWIGSISAVILLYLMVAKLIPLVNIAEQKELLLYKLHKEFHRTKVMVLGKPE